MLTVTDGSGEQPEGFGRVGKLSHVMTLGEFGKYVKECNHIPDVRVYGDLDRKIETVAICTGSGKSMIGDVMAAGADVYVTGDIDYHTAIDTMADGLAIVDAGHYGTEYIFAEAMERELNEAFPALKRVANECAPERLSTAISPVKKQFRNARRRFGTANKKYSFRSLCPKCNDDDRRQRRKQGGVVGAAASKTRVPPKARCGCWVPQPGRRGAHFKSSFTRCP